MSVLAAAVVFLLAATAGVSSVAYLRTSQALEIATESEREARLAQPRRALYEHHPLELSGARRAPYAWRFNACKPSRGRKPPVASPA